MKPKISNHSISNQALADSNLATQKPDITYSVQKNKTTSQSAQSKLKNLAYTLSRPFRSLMKGHIEKSIGPRNSMGAIKNINAQTTSNRKTQVDSTSTPKTSEAISTASGSQAYEVVSRRGGYRSPPWV